jgi:hypothetical protein
LLFEGKPKEESTCTETWIEGVTEVAINNAAALLPALVIKRTIHASWMFQQNIVILSFSPAYYLNMQVKEHNIPDLI